MKPRYTYSQSIMRPPFWIVKDREREMAEVWSEADAELIVKALEAHWEPVRQQIARDLAARLIGH